VKKGPVPRPASHFCGLLLARLSGCSVEFLVLDYRRFGRTVTKFPGGMSTDGEIPFVDMVKTVRREAREEIGDSSLPEDKQIEIMLPDEWLSQRIVAEIDCSSSGDSEHWKYFFIVAFDEIKGEIRSQEIIDNETLLFTPRWIRAEDLYPIIFAGHLPAFVMGLKWLCDISESLTASYSYIFRNVRVMEIVAEQERR